MCVPSARMARDSLSVLFEHLRGFFSQSPSQQTLLGSSALVIGLSALPVLYHGYLIHQFQDEVPMSFSWIPILGHALEFGSNPIKTLQRLSRNANGKIKDIFGLVLAGKRIILINDPLSFKVIFKSKKELSFDVFSRQVLINVFGATPETTNGIHTEAEPLSRTHYNKYLLQDEGCGILTDRMQIKLGEIIRDLPAVDATVDMFSFLNRLIFRAAATSLFNVELGDDDEIFQKFVAFDDVFALALAGCPMKFLTKGYEGRELLLGQILKYQQGLSGFIQERHQLLGGRFHYPDRDIQANHLSMLWASVGNTMPATFWVFYYLLNAPEALAAVREEIETVLHAKISDLRKQNDSSDLLMVTLEDLQKMVILESCISESLRLSTGSLIMREAVEPCTLTLADGSTYKIRKGDNVGIFPPIIHRDERFFENSETFQYDRFLKMKDTFIIDGREVPSSQCFLPFGGGVSYCPGRKFARNEIKTLAIHLLLKFEMSLSGSSVSKPVAVDYSRAGLGIFQPKDCTLQLKLTSKK